MTLDIKDTVKCSEVATCTISSCGHKIQYKQLKIDTAHKELRRLITEVEQAAQQDGTKLVFVKHQNTNHWDTMVAAQADYGGNPWYISLIPKNNCVPNVIKLRKVHCIYSYML